ALARTDVADQALVGRRQALAGAEEVVLRGDRHLLARGEEDVAVSLAQPDLVTTQILEDCDRPAGTHLGFADGGVHLAVIVVRSLAEVEAGGTHARPDQN